MIKDVVKSLAKNHTIVFVAHRLSTVVDSDNIIVVEDGKINTQGTHEQLMTSCKYYHKVYRTSVIDFCRRQRYCWESFRLKLKKKIKGVYVC